MIVYDFLFDLMMFETLQLYSSVVVTRLYSSFIFFFASVSL